VEFEDVSYRQTGLKSTKEQAEMKVADLIRTRADPGLEQVAIRFGIFSAATIC
jgi:hypothetical protein